MDQTMVKLAWERDGAKINIVTVTYLFPLIVFCMPIEKRSYMIASLQLFSHHLGRVENFVERAADCIWRSFARLRIRERNCLTCKFQTCITMDILPRVIGDTFSLDA